MTIHLNKPYRWTHNGTEQVGRVAMTVDGWPARLQIKHTPGDHALMRDDETGGLYLVLLSELEPHNVEPIPEPSPKGGSVVAGADRVIEVLSTELKEVEAALRREYMRNVMYVPLCIRKW